MINPQLNTDPIGATTLAVISRADKFNRWMYDTIRHYLKGEILEVGSGIGNISKYLIPGDHPVTLSDYNREYRVLLQEKFGHHKNVVAIIEADLQHRQFEQQYMRYKEKFDSIFMLNVIEHLADDRQAVENCRYMLRVGGNLIVLAPAYPSLFCRLDKELGHYRRYTLKSLSRVISMAGLTIINRQYFNSLGIAGWWISGQVFNSKSLGKNEMSAFNRLVPVAKLFDKIIFKKAGLSAIVIAQKK
jgi:2-polyprenyl-3-methyl-5-hydroxy-6-metoxy-1,4-benzoquinol methylase